MGVRVSDAILLLLPQHRAQQRSGDLGILLGEGPDLHGLSDRQRLLLILGIVLLLVIAILVVTRSSLAISRESCSISSSLRNL